jgi:Arc/MetJ-type ribon-helix-helix transcriptional regulator
MTITLPKDLENTIRDELHLGHFTSADELVAQAVRSFLSDPTTRRAASASAPIGAIRGTADESDRIIAEAVKMRLETIRAVREGFASLERGEGTPMDEVFDALEAELRTKDRG